MATRKIGFTLVVTCALPILLLVERSTGGKVAILLLLILICSLLIYTECRFEYTRQPPSDVQTTNGGDCNPYMMMMMPPGRPRTVKIIISLECVVRRQSGDDSFEIRWFRNTTGEVEDLGLGDPDMPQGNQLLSRYHNTKLFNQQYNPNLLGKYWCQVIINTTADPDLQPLMKSNVFTLLPPENYTGPHCSSAPISSSFQAINNVTCADLPVTNQSDQTPQVVIMMSTTTQQTTTDTTSIWTGNIASFVSSPSATPLVVPSPGQQTLLAVVASVGGLLLIIAIILVVVIAVMLAMKKKKMVRQTDQKGRVVHILDVINLLITLLPSDNIITTCQYVHQCTLAVVVMVLL